MAPQGEQEPWQAEPARRLVSYPLGALADWSVTFVRAAPDEVREGSTWLTDRRIVVYVREDWSKERTANAMAHELGHVHDAMYLSSKQRDAYLRARGLRWIERYFTVKWPAFSKREPRKRQSVGAEDFAEVFAVRWGPAAEFQSTVRPRPSSDELGRLDAFLRPPSG